MSNIDNKIKKTLGFKGESFVIDKLKTLGYELHKRNIKSIDSEIDVIAYRYNKQKYRLDIRIIEVKTRQSYEFDLTNLGMAKKWGLIRRHMFNIKGEIDAKFDVLSYSEVHFDLALVRYKNDSLELYSYIKDINLML